MKKILSLTYRNILNCKKEILKFSILLFGLSLVSESPYSFPILILISLTSSLILVSIIILLIQFNIIKK